MIKKKKLLTLISAIAVIGIAVFVFFEIKPANEKLHKIRKGNLEVVVNCKGEVRGEKFTEINLPEVICDEELRIFQFKIADVVLEGKAVKKGDYIAKLDDSQIVTNMRNNMQEKEKEDADLRNVVLDSTVTLSQRREAINNARLDLEYLKIDLEQSKYESEAYQRKTRMNYQKAEMEIEKIRRNYLLERNRLKLQVSRYQERVARYQDKIEKYQAALAATTITSPEDGIVMFAKDWAGKTYGKDSQINIWRPAIATLPDMSVAVSEVFVREIDISKIELDDSVRITIDALPERLFWGKVIKIANIGEDHKDFDMKVFRVVVRFDQSDKEMKPGMNANNDIIIASYQGKLLVPLKGIFTKNGKQLVYLKNGSKVTEQPIEVIAENEQFGVVEEAVKEGDVVLLYQPDEFRPEATKVASR
ncbi:MAG: efflux RND transporter periplasmic adaptor subunit [Prolixibacteraceae bacterium]|nr:efflux RND transporter periplasmic adaptor subunit [Prolixibacteraceae bacterium]